MMKTRDFVRVAFLGGTLLCTVPALADEARQREAVITVTGQGHASIAPDMAIVTLSVVKDAKAAQDALDQNSKAMGAVLATLKNSGIADRDLQTTGFAIQPQYTFPTDKNGQAQQPVLNGYQVTNGLTVRVRDLTKLGAIIDQAVNLGVNQGGDIQFTNDSPDAVLGEARKNAVADAIAKAKALTEAAGVKTGRIVSINEGSPAVPPQPFARQAMAMASDKMAVPVASGENTFNATVSITYAIVQ